MREQQVWEGGEEQGWSKGGARDGWSSVGVMGELVVECLQCWEKPFLSFVHVQSHKNKPDFKSAARLRNV